MLDLNSLKSRPHRWALNVGDQVTGVEGRVSCGWTGEIKAIEDLPGGRLYYRVYWKERAESENPLVAKSPVIGMMQNQIRRVG